MLRALKRAEVEKIIAAAERLNEKDPPDATGTCADDITASSILENGNYQQELISEIESLAENGRIELLALMWIGRGDFDGTFNDAVVYARQSSNYGDAHYIAAKSPVLPAYLRRGLETIGIALPKK